MEQLEKALIDYVSHNENYVTVDLGDEDSYENHLLTKQTFLEYVNLYHKDALCEAQELPDSFSVLVKIVAGNLTEKIKLVRIFDSRYDAQSVIEKNLRESVTIVKTV